MAKLKTHEELEQERLDFIQRISGNYPLPTSRPALLYVRQSSIKQVRNNIYSALQQTEDMIERAIALEWSREECTIFVENNMTKDGRIRGVSGTIPIEHRPGLKTVMEHIKRGAGALLCVDVSRLTRDADLVDAANLAQTCRKHNAVIVTSDHVYDFRKDGELDRFMDEAREAANYLKRQVGSKEYPNGKMYRGRNKKAEKGRLVVPVAPVGLKVNATRDNLVSSVHADRVGWLYGRFRALDANLAGLLREIVSMANQGIPLFPDHESIDPATMFLKRIDRGWTIASLPGLKHILTNPSYQGHLVYNGRIIKRNAHPAIVDADTWQYAFDHLADVDLDGNPIEREKKARRYTQHGNTSTALLAGTRDNGKLVIDSVNGAHVYVNANNNTYVVRKRDAFSVTGFIAGITTSELDDVVVERVLCWCLLYEQRCEHQECEQAAHLAMDVVEQREQPVSTVEDDALEQARKKLARVVWDLENAGDVMDVETRREQYASKARLLTRIAKLEQAQVDEERRERERKQAEDDILHACDKWHKWTVDERRQFLRLVTESVTLEEIASGWLRLVIVWSPLMGFVSPPTSSTRAVDTLYLWRSSGDQWSEDEKAILKAHYPTATPDDMLHLLPSRSWIAIKGKANKMGLYRELLIVPPAIDVNMSLTDVHVVKEFALEAGKRVQWQHEIVSNLSNFESLS